MAVIPELTENADAALGLLTEANSFVDKITGAGAGAQIVDGGYDGPRAIRVAPAGSPNINRVDYPAKAVLWQSWYIEPETWPSTTPTATDAWYSGDATKVADVRPAADRTLELRSANNSRWTSTPLASNEWHRVAVLIAPNISGTGTLRLRIYSGATRDSMTVSQDSQNRNAAVMVASTDNYRWGCLSPDILRYKRDRFRADDAIEPAGVPTVIEPPPDPDPEPDVVAGEVVALREDFAGGVLGNPVGAGNSIFGDPSGTGSAATFTDDAYDGELAMLVDGNGGTNINRVDFPTQSRLWLTKYQKIVEAASANTATIAAYLNDTKIMDVQQTPDRRVRLRSVNNERWVSEPLPLGSDYRVGLLIEPNAQGTGQLRVHLYSGDDLDGDVPTQDSEPWPASALAAGVNNIRLGTLGADATLAYVIDRLRASSTVEPGGVPTAEPDPDPEPPAADALIITAGGDQVVRPYQRVYVTAGATGGAPPYTYGLQLVSGGPLDIPGLTTATRSFIAPARADGAALVIRRTVTDSVGTVSASDDMTVTVVPHAEHRWASDGDLVPTRWARA